MRFASELGLPWEFLVSLLAFLTFINLPLFLLDVQLVLLHLFLISQDLTTYEYIVGKRDMEQEEAEPDEPEDEENGRPAMSKRERARAAGRRAIRTLPACADWIVFSRCGRRRRQRAKAAATAGEPVTELVDRAVPSRERCDFAYPEEPEPAPEASPERGTASGVLGAAEKGPVSEARGDALGLNLLMLMEEAVESTRTSPEPSRSKVSEPSTEGVHDHAASNASRETS